MRRGTGRAEVMPPELGTDAELHRLADELGQRHRSAGSAGARFGRAQRLRARVDEERAKLTRPVGKWASTLSD